MKGMLWCAALAAAGVACTPIEKKPPAAQAPADTAPLPAPPPPVPTATKVTALEGFQVPVAVLYDTAQDVYFVSNVNGSGTARDNNGFISRVKPDGTIENLKFIEGGRNGTLNAPKGLALQGDTLWVTDIDVVRSYNARTGVAMDSISLTAVKSAGAATSGAVFLNGLVVTPTGALYITDTGIRFDDVGNVLHPGPDRLFRIGPPPERAVSVALRGDSLGRPSGIALDAVGKRLIVVQLGGKAVLAWKPEDKAPTVIGRGAGGFDGVVMAGRRLLVASQTDSSVSSYESGQAVRLISGLPDPATIGYDAKRNRVLIPLLSTNRVEIWQLP